MILLISNLYMIDVLAQFVSNDKYILKGLLRFYLAEYSIVILLSFFNFVILPLHFENKTEVYSSVMWC
jgi:hypothetical protein